jgi:small GTP-binding protein
MNGAHTTAIAASLGRWRSSLRLSNREQALLGPELQGLDRQLARLGAGILKIAVFGRVGVGKSSLLNALLGQEHFRTDVAHGCTRHQEQAPWPRPVPGLQQLLLVDTPGIDEIAAAARQRLASRVAAGSDLVLMVLDGDLSSPELEALQVLQASGKPLLLVANRSDRWDQAQRQELERAIRRRASSEGQPSELPLLWVAAAPRQPRPLADGRVRSVRVAADVEALEAHLLPLLEAHGALLLALNSLRWADRFNGRLLEQRLGQRQKAAQGLIGRFAALKAAGLAANPLALLDLAGSAAVDGALVLQLCQLYEIPLKGPQARRLLQQIGRNGAWIGGAQLGLQGLLGMLKQLLLLAAPASGGLSLAPAAPVALAQAALAVHSTRITGRETARQLLLGAHQGPSRPAALLRRLCRQEPQAGIWLRQHATWKPGVGLP